MQSYFSASKAPLIIGAVIAVVLTFIALSATITSDIDARMLRDLGITALIAVAAFFTGKLTFRLFRSRRKE